MLHSRSRRGDRCRKRRGPVSYSGRIVGNRRSDRGISVKIEDNDEDERARLYFPIVRFLNRLGPKERFLAFADFSAYYECNAAEITRLRIRTMEPR